MDRSVVGSESDPPYSRPALSKGLWKGKPLDKIWRRTEDFNVALHLERKVVSLDATQHRLVDDQGEIYTGENCYWQQAALRDGCHLAARRSSISGRWRITGGWLS